MKALTALVLAAAVSALAAAGCVCTCRPPAADRGLVLPPADTAEAEADAGGTAR